MRITLVTVALATFAGCSPSHQEHSMNATHEHAQGTHKHTSLGTHEGHPSVGESELIVSTQPRNPRIGEKIALGLMIHSADGRMQNDFETVHEHKVHLMIVRDD